MTVKSRILQELERSDGRAVSGQSLADALGVSRAAVWKGIQALRSEGYAIEAATNRGYRLAMGGEKLSSEGVSAHRAGRFADAPVYVHDVLDSTNTEIKRLALNGAPHGTLVLADGQTAGRGRRGHTFFSPPGTGLYMSALLRAEARPSEAYRFTLAAAVAVCDAVQAELGVRPGIKWVNDMLVDGRKVAGLLTEAVTDFESGLTEFVVIGMGINLQPPQGGFPPDVAPVAAALCDVPVNRNRLAARLADALFEALALSPERLLERYRADCVVPGRRIRFQMDGREREAMALAVQDDGGLLVQLADGTRQTLHSGEISVSLT
ncbi:MAG: biotin--[acetyl-CoA-carboxylase] ligase [Clostridia bacterium]|nr:biotin--[acetyl-CoA-carboxylase] ligase [Clostridia bacterium]